MVSPNPNCVSCLGETEHKVDLELCIAEWIAQLRYDTSLGANIRFNRGKIEGFMARLSLVATDVTFLQGKLTMLHREFEQLVNVLKDDRKKDFQAV